MAELKPCPFCGGKVKVRYKMPMNWIECKRCNCSMVQVDSYAQRDREQELIEAWNRRADNAK